jgi:hypothetical protein
VRADATTRVDEFDACTSALPTTTMPVIPRFLVPCNVQ